MVKINYQAFGKEDFKLRLRLYQDGKTKYIVVTHLLKGKPKREHWNPKEQRFTPDAPRWKENNDILDRFKNRFQNVADDWEGSVFGIASSVDMEINNDIPTLTAYIHKIAEKAKRNAHPDGTLKSTFEEYLKFDKRLREFAEERKIQYNKLLLTSVTPAFVNNVFNWVQESRKGKGFRYISKDMHSVLMKADKEGYVNMEDFKNIEWFKDRQVSSQKFHTLSEIQIKKFKELDLFSISKSQYNELYRDLCVFLLYTGQSPCDAMALRYSDITYNNGTRYFVFNRRKIAERQLVPCAVPISEEMEKIMNRWKWMSKDGYVFPVRSKIKIGRQATNNGDIRHFLGNLNNWLKKIGKALGCGFPLRAYTFRHTAITRYVSEKIPLPYLSNMMGTSVENIEKIYYNNMADITSRNMVLSAMKI